jgi:hypothetical protein
MFLIIAFRKGFSNVPKFFFGNFLFKNTSLERVLSFWI